MVPKAHMSHHPKQHLDRSAVLYAVQCIVNGKENPQNCLFPLVYRHSTREGPSHSDRQHAQKNGKDRAYGSGDMLADRQTHTILQYFATAPANNVLVLVLVK